eukprot:1626248-Ditylum_brightwellii.AAC.1
MGFRAWLEKKYVDLVAMKCCAQLPGVQLRWVMLTNSPPPKMYGMVLKALRLLLYRRYLIADPGQASNQLELEKGVFNQLDELVHHCGLEFWVWSNGDIKAHDSTFTFCCHVKRLHSCKGGGGPFRLQKDITMYCCESQYMANCAKALKIDVTYPVMKPLFVVFRAPKKWSPRMSRWLLPYPQWMALQWRDTHKW